MGGWRSKFEALEEQRGREVKIRDEGLAEQEAMLVEQEAEAYQGRKLAQAAEAFAAQVSQALAERERALEERDTEVQFLRTLSRQTKAELNELRLRRDAESQAQLDAFIQFW